MSSAKTKKILDEVLDTIADGTDTDPRIAASLEALVADGYRIHEAGVLEPGDFVAYVETDVFGMGPAWDADVQTAKVRRIEPEPRWGGLLVHHSGGQTEIMPFEYVLALKS